MTTLRNSPESSLVPKAPPAGPADPIHVMISSRCKDRIPHHGGRKTVPLLEVRRDLKEELEKVTLWDRKLFKVWINEDDGGESTVDTVWEKCRAEMRKAQIIIVIYNGHAGWCRQGVGIGICHEEIKYAFDHFPSKLYLVKVKPEAPSSQADKAFAEFMKGVNRWQVEATDDESVMEKVRIAVAKAVSDLTATGSREGRKGRYYFGSPLAWSRLTYQERKVRIEEAATDYLLQMGARELPLPEPEGAPGLLWELDGAQTLLLVHGVPSSFGIAEAREMVGRPYLFDHATPAPLSGGLLLGPVHIIACHKSCSESRILSFMGHPDVYIVQTPFGFFAADLVTFVQAFFLTDCRDRDSTFMGLERMFEWITEANETKGIVARARSRQRILSAIRAEMEAQAAPGTTQGTILVKIEEPTNSLPLLLWEPEASLLVE